MASSKFSDVLDLNHPWVEKYRIPVIDFYDPRYYYFAALVIPDLSIEDPLFKFVMPTEEDAKLFGSYITYRISQFGFREGYVNKIHSEKLDVDSGVNTISYAKHEVLGWCYKRATWETGPFPHYGTSIRFETLVEAMDHCESIAGEPSKDWEAWKTEHNLR